MCPHTSREKRGEGGAREKKKRERRKIMRNEIPFDPDVKQTVFKASLDSGNNL